jgi:hypothetical protein
MRINNNIPYFPLLKNRLTNVSILTSGSINQEGSQQHYHYLRYSGLSLTTFTKIQFNLNVNIMFLIKYVFKLQKHVAGPFTRY